MIFKCYSYALYKKHIALKKFKQKKCRQWMKYGQIYPISYVTSNKALVTIGYDSNSYVLLVTNGNKGDKLFHRGS